MKMATAILASAILLGGVALGLVLNLGTYQQRNSSALPEYLALDDAIYGVGNEGWIAVKVNNTGIGSVTLVKLEINDTKKSSVSPPLPITIAPDAGAVLIAPLNVTEGATYQIDVFTAQGNRFSTSDQEHVTHTTGQAGVVLFPANVNFYANGTRIDIDIGNSGTSDTNITQLYIGLSPSNLQNETITPVLVNAGTVQRITVNYNWTSGVNYYFKAIASNGQSLPWPQQAP